MEDIAFQVACGFRISSSDQRQIFTHLSYWMSKISQPIVNCLCCHFFISLVFTKAGQEQGIYNSECSVLNFLPSFLTFYHLGPFQQGEIQMFNRMLVVGQSWKAPSDGVQEHHRHILAMLPVGVSSGGSSCAVELPSTASEVGSLPAVILTTGKIYCPSDNRVSVF